MKKGNYRAGAVLLIINCFLPLFSGAQGTIDTSNVSTKNTPYQIRPLKIQLLMLTMDAFNFGSGIQADYHFKHAVLQFQGRKAFYSGFLKPDITNKKVLSSNALSSFRSLELGGEYYLADYARIKFYDYSDKGYSYKDDSAKIRRIIAFRAGLFRTAGYTNIDSASSYFTNYITYGSSLGIAIKRIDKYKGHQHHDGVREWFIDVLTGKTSLESIILKTNGSEYQPQSLAFHKLGWRLGYQRYGEHWYIGWEMGLRPALVNPDSFKASIPFNYFVINFGFTIFGNEKWN